MPSRIRHTTARSLRFVFLTLSFILLMSELSLAVPAQLVSVAGSVTGDGKEAVSEGWLSAVKKNIERAEYQPSLQTKDSEGRVFEHPKWHFVNRGNQFRSYVDGTGWEIRPSVVKDGEESWSWKYEFVGVYRGGEQASAKGVSQGKVRNEGAAVYIEHSPDLVEWYKNTLAGIEQGFEIRQRPAGDLKRPLIMRGVVKSSLIADSASAEAVTFSTSKGAVLRYAGLKVVDSRGELLKSSMIFDKEQHTLDLQIDDSEAVYPLTVDPLATSPAWTAESDQASAEFGISVSIAGDVNGDGYSDVIVGAYRFDNGENNEGRSFVYYGGASGLSATPAWTAESDQASVGFG
jgi:hypothetical protein